MNRWVVDEATAAVGYLVCGTVVLDLVHGLDLDQSVWDNGSGVVITGIFVTAASSREPNSLEVPARGAPCLGGQLLYPNYPPIP